MNRQQTFQMDVAIALSSHGTVQGYCGLKDKADDKDPECEATLHIPTPTRLER